MRELMITNDPVLLGYVEVLLADQGISSLVFDQHISVVEGSIGAFPRRLMVAGDHWPRAVRVMQDAGLAQWIKSDETT
ncbi:MAG: DUF2007 domain-containing protein [Hyphomicrobium sp.]|nr:DUF2007 domain-containing protein [Hyphomicrobium sp.]